MLGQKDAAATVAVRDIARAKAFYRDVIGMTPTQEMAAEGVVEFRSGASTVVVYRSDFAGTNKATTLTFAAGGDFDRVVADLRTKGVAFEHYDMPGAAHEGDVHVFGTMRLAWFKDPDGNIIHVHNM